MRALKKFKIEKGFTYKEFLVYLNEKGIKISMCGLVFWCMDFSSPYHAQILPKHVPRLIEITGYGFADFYRDIPCDGDISGEGATVAEVVAPAGPATG